MDSSLEVLHDVEEGWGELQAMRRDDEQWKNTRFARQRPAGSRHSGPFQAAFRPTTAQVRSEASRRRDGWPDLALAGVRSNGGKGFRGRKVREDRENKKKEKKRKKREK